MQTNWRKGFLFGVAGSLGVLALYAIFVVISGQYSQIAMKIMLTTLSVGFYSLTGLCCTPQLEEPLNRRLLGYTGIVVSILGLVYACLTNWFGVDLLRDFAVLLRFRFFFFILAITIAHISLLLIIHPRNSLVRYIQLTTIACVLIVATILLAELTLFTLSDPLIWQILAVFAILDALGSIVTPILHAASKSS